MTSHKLDIIIEQMSLAGFPFSTTPPFCVVQGRWKTLAQGPIWAYLIFCKITRAYSFLEPY